MVPVKHSELLFVQLDEIVALKRLPSDAVPDMLFPFTEKLTGYCLSS